MSPRAIEYGVPGDVHTTVDPSPICHTTRTTRAVAVTDTPGTAAVADTGPHVCGDTAVHNHTGRPTRPVLPCCGAIPITGPRSGNNDTARAANIAGVAPTPPNPGGGVGSHNHPPPLPPDPGQVATYTAPPV